MRERTVMKTAARAVVIDPDPLWQQAVTAALKRSEVSVVANSGELRRAPDRDADHQDEQRRPRGLPAAPPQPTPAAPAPTPSGNEVIVKSPIVGTYYESPKPGDPPFVKVGDFVEPGQVLCIIESMKLMNEIESETAGTIVAKLMENGRAVEYGEALFAIRPR